MRFICIQLLYRYCSSMYIRTTCVPVLPHMVSCFSHIHGTSPTYTWYITWSLHNFRLHITCGISKQVVVKVSTYLLACYNQYIPGKCCFHHLTNCAEHLWQNARNSFINFRCSNIFSSMICVLDFIYTDYVRRSCGNMSVMFFLYGRCPPIDSSNKRKVIYTKLCPASIYSWDTHHCLYSWDTHHCLYSWDTHHCLYSWDTHHCLYSWDTLHCLYSWDTYHCLYSWDTHHFLYSWDIHHCLYSWDTPHCLYSWDTHHYLYSWGSFSFKSWKIVKNILVLQFIYLFSKLFFCL